MFSVTLIFAALVASHSLRLFSKQAVLQPFRDGNALKIISGLSNKNFDSVLDITTAAYVGGASHVDIACDARLVSAVKSKIQIPVCVSSVVPSEFVEAVTAGADMIEIGNFDSFYSQGIKFTSEDVIQMTKETRILLPDTPLSVTIPRQLPLDEQIALAKELELCGADIIQTEGKFKANPSSLGLQEMIELAAPTLASAFAISRAVNIPVMCASGLTDVTAPLAIAAGARGVGVGSMISQLQTPQAMLMAVSALSSSLGRQQQLLSETYHDIMVNSKNSVASQAVPLPGL